MAKTTEPRWDPLTGTTDALDADGHWIVPQITDFRFRPCDASNLEADYKRQQAASPPLLPELHLDALPSVEHLKLAEPDPAAVARRLALLAQRDADERALPGLRDGVKRAGEVEQQYVASALAEGRQAHAADLVGARLEGEAALRQREARLSTSKMAVELIDTMLAAEYETAKDALRAECDALKNEIVQQCGRCVDRLMALHALGRKVFLIRHQCLTVYQQQTSYVPSSFEVPNDRALDFARDVVRDDGYKLAGS